MRTALLLGALTLVACAGAPLPARVTAEDLLARGQLGDALLHEDLRANPALKERVTRAAAAALDPTLTLEPLTDEELVKILGRSAARRASSGWLIVRATLDSQERGLGPVALDVVVQSPKARVPAVRRHVESLAVVTQEHFPPGRVDTRWTTEDFPFLVDFFSLGLSRLLTLRSVTTVTPAPDAEVIAAVPRAIRLAGALADRAISGRLSTALVLRRPAEEDGPLSLRVSVSTNMLSVRTSIPLSAGSPGASLRERLAAVRGVHLAGRAATEVGLATEQRKPEPCGRGELERRFDVEQSPCATLALRPWPGTDLERFGVELPPRPAALGTPESSAAARPWWTSQALYAPSGAVLRNVAPTPAGPIDAGLLSCSVAGGEQPYFHFMTLEMGRRRWRHGRGLTAPLLRLDAKGKLRIQLEHDGRMLGGLIGSIDRVGTLSIERRNDAWTTVSSPRPRHDVTCSLFERGAVETAFEQAFVAAVDAFEFAEETSATPRLDLARFGVEEAMKAPRRAVEQAAALVGWDDERVRSLVARADRMEAAVLASVKGALRALPVGADGVAHLPRRKGEEELDALPRVTGCAATRKARYLDAAEVRDAVCVEVEATNRTQRTLPYGGQWEIVLEDGRVLETRHWSPAERWLNPGEHATVTLYALDVPPPSRGVRPWALVERTGERLVRLPAPSP